MLCCVMLRWVQLCDSLDYMFQSFAAELISRPHHACSLGC